MNYSHTAIMIQKVNTTKVPSQNHTFPLSSSFPVIFTLQQNPLLSISPMVFPVGIVLLIRPIVLKQNSYYNCLSKTFQHLFTGRNENLNVCGAKKYFCLDQCCLLMIIKMNKIINEGPNTGGNLTCWYCNCVSQVYQMYCP